MTWNVASRTLAVVFLCVGTAGAPIEPIRLALVALVSLALFFFLRTQPPAAIAVSLFVVTALGSFAQHDTMPALWRLVPAGAVALVVVRTRNNDAALALAAVCGAGLLFLA